MNIFIKKFLNTFIRFHLFWNLNNIKNIVYFDVPNHCILKKFQERDTYFFPWTFWLGTQIWNMIYDFFPNVIWKSFYF